MPDEILDIYALGCMMEETEHQMENDDIVDYEQMVKDELANGKFPVIVSYPDKDNEELAEIIEEEKANEGIWIAPANLFLGEFYHSFDTTPINEEIAIIKKDELRLNISGINQFEIEFENADLYYPDNIDTYYPCDAYFHYPITKGFLVWDGSTSGDIISVIKSLSFVDSIYLYDAKSDKIIRKL